MKLRSIIVMLVVVVVMLSSCNMKKGVSLKTETDTISYIIGTNIGQSIMQDRLDTLLDMDIIAQGIFDVVDSVDPKIDQMQAQMLMQTFFMKRQQEQMEKLYGHNKIVGQEFLAQNKQRPEVTELPSGLQYEVLAEGKGLKPVPGEKVTTNYHGTFLDGTVFDSSIDKGTPFSFKVGGQVIAGWNEAIQLMTVGSKWKIFVPYYLAYGERGYGRVEPYKMLIFELELLSIDKEEGK